MVPIAPSRKTSRCFKSAHSSSPRAVSGRRWVGEMVGEGGISRYESTYLDALIWQLGNQTKIRGQLRQIATIMEPAQVLCFGDSSSFIHDCGTLRRSPHPAGGHRA